MQRRAMEQDFSWINSARQYIDLYTRAIDKRKELSV
jgi:glycogen synthase